MATVIRQAHKTASHIVFHAGHEETQRDAEFLAALSWLLPDPIARRGGRIETLQEPLHEAEAAFVRNAVDRRVREFTAGRTCARGALNQLGLHDFPVCMGARRQPLWPEGVTGSISHAAGYCIAAVCTRDHLAALGVDIESAAPLSDALIDLVCTPREKAWCETRREQGAGIPAKFVFSAKEAVFKCLYPVFGEELDFEDINLALDMNRGRFCARVSCIALDVDQDLEVTGRLACTSSLVMTSAMIADSDLDGLSRRYPVRRLTGCEGRYVCE